MNAAFNVMNFAGVKPFWNPDLARTMAVKIGASLTLPAGQLLGEVTATPGVYAAYDKDNSDGTEVLKAILEHAVTTDADALITNWIGPFGVGVPAPLAVPAWISGIFKTTELTGDSIAAAVTAKRLVILQGDATTGVVQLV